MKHKTTKTNNLFAEEFRLDKISGQHDPLIKLNERIEWEQFRSLLNDALYKEPKGAGGCRPYDYVMMFKVLILQRYYNISDDKTEFAILDRLSFMRFLGLTLSDRVPDAKTIWHFREKLIAAGVIEKLFELFQSQLKEKGLIANEGKIIDASFVEVPIQRNTKEENEQLKKGNKPEKWEEKPHKLAQKDTDAKWTKKNDKDYFGYKNHIKADEKSKLIDDYIVTDASVHDSQVVEQLVTNIDEGQTLYADSAYSGEPVAEIVNTTGMTNSIHEKGYRNHPLTEKQKENNRIKSKKRVRIEHIFGFVENSMNGSYIRTIGIKRATAVIGLMNLTYNMFRYIQLSQV
jgi:transposase, IS5 family